MREIENPLGERKGKKRGQSLPSTLTVGQNTTTTCYIYDAEKPILEFDQNGQLTRNLYGKGIDEILMRTDPTVNGDAALYYQRDHEGSVTHLTNAAGNKIEGKKRKGKKEEKGSVLTINTIG